MKRVLKCANCGKMQIDHRHGFLCPVGRKQRVTGYMAFSATSKFKEKKMKRAPKCANCGKIQDDQ